MAARQIIHTVFNYTDPVTLLSSKLTKATFPRKGVIYFTGIVKFGGVNVGVFGFEVSSYGNDGDMIVYSVPGVPIALASQFGSNWENYMDSIVKHILL